MKALLPDPSWAKKIGCIAAASTLAACTMSEDVRLTNATGTEVLVSQPYSYKGVHRSTKQPMPPGGATLVMFKSRITITTGNIMKVYVPSLPPKSFTERVHDFGPFMARRAYATLAEDGCIRLATVDGEHGKPAASQPEGFPLCPSEKHDFSPPEPPAPRGPSLPAIKAFAEKVGTWSCPVPAGGEHIRPLYALEAHDRARIREARERIELLRRRQHGNWDAAALAFRKVQVDFDDNDTYLAQLKISAQQHFDHDAKGGILVTARNLDYAAMYDMGKREYDGYCAARNKSIGDMLADAPALASLLKETRRPWLQERLRIPCDVAMVPRCTR